MTSLFSRDALKRPPKRRCGSSSVSRRSRLPLQIILEEDEPHSSTSSSSSSPTRSERQRYPSTSISNVKGSHENVHCDNDLQFDNLLFSPRLTSQPIVTSPRSSYCQPRSASASPTPSASSTTSSGSPLTPCSSDDEFFACETNLRPVSIKPLVINKTRMMPTLCKSTSSFFESDSDEESDSEWYTREFSKIITLSSPIPPSFPTQQPSRPESMSLESLMQDITSQPEPSSPPPPPPPPKRPLSHTHKRSRSAPKEVPPPVPPLPDQFRPLSSSSISEGTKTTSNKVRPRSLCLRRPPPRTSIPSDCVLDDILNEEEDGSWSSAFDLSIYEQPSPAPSPAFISQNLAAPVAFNSPASMYSQNSALPIISVEDVEEHGEIEFVVDDITFSLDMNMPMRLPLSLPDSPIDLETDIANGLAELRSRQQQEELLLTPSAIVPPMIAVSEVDVKHEEVTEKEEAEEGQVITIPAMSLWEPAMSVPTSPLPISPATDASFESYQSRHDPDDDVYLSSEPVSATGSTRPVLRSKWSSSTLASLREEHAARSPRGPTSFLAANKLRLYFGGGSSPLSKYKQQQLASSGHQKKEHKRSGSAAAIAAAKAAVARAAGGAVYPYSPTSSPSKKSSAVKKAQRQVVVVPPQSPQFPSFSPPVSPVSPGFAHANPKKGWNGRASEVMVIGYGFSRVGQERERVLRRRGSLTPTVSDAGSEQSTASSLESPARLRRKPIPVEMFLRNTSAGSA